MEFIYLIAIFLTLLNPASSQQYFPLTDFYRYHGAYGSADLGVRSPLSNTQAPPTAELRATVEPKMLPQTYGSGPYQHTVMVPNIYAYGDRPIQVGMAPYQTTYWVPNPAPDTQPDTRHSGDEFNGFYLMCSSANCGRGRKRK
uniref:Uncharacterized protein n=1 Tax=Ditylenchus dipsaci TaxID=166011 RepID=A0A915DSW6_9BILA